MKGKKISEKILSHIVHLKNVDATWGLCADLREPFKYWIPKFFKDSILIHQRTHVEILETLEKWLNENAKNRFKFMVDISDEIQKGIYFVYGFESEQDSKKFKKYQFFQNQRW